MLRSRKEKFLHEFCQNAELCRVLLKVIVLLISRSGFKTALSRHCVVRQENSLCVVSFHPGTAKMWVLAKHCRE